jgi:integrase
MPLTVVRRKSSGALTISGIVAGRRVQRRAQSDDPKLAGEEAAALEAEILRAAWHGERRGARSFEAAVKSYIDAAPRHANTKRRLRRILAALGDVKLSTVDQDAVTRLGKIILRQPSAPATVLREVISPIRAVLRHAQRRGWCSTTAFENPRVVDGRTLFMTPAEAECLIAATAAHIKPLLVFLLSTGARISEAIYLDWRDVDLVGARAIFWPDRTKSRKRRVAALAPRSVVALTGLPARSGAVFLTDDGQPYKDHGGEYGGQIKTAWRGAIRRADLNPAFTPHTCRHTWASWHYAVHKDLLKLKVEGGWSSVSLVERYAHLLPAGHTAAIRSFWGCDEAVTETRSPRLTA